MRVWVSSLRKGISWHVIANDGKRTKCGRYFGQLNIIGEPARGHIIGRVKAVDELASHQCQHCSGTAEVVDPVKGRQRWTS